jgi:hypothetical protein
MNNDGFWGTRGQPLGRIFDKGLGGCPLVPQKPSLLMDDFAFTFKRRPN